MKYTVLIFLFFLKFTLNAQSGYDVDTVISLKHNVSGCYLNFEGKKQGFYWDTDEQTRLGDYYWFYIINNSKHDITVNKISEGNSVIKMKSVNKLPLIIHPNDIFSIMATIQTKAEHIDLPIEVFCTKNSKNDTLTIPTWQNETRSSLLRIYRGGIDISRYCKVYTKKEGFWTPLEVNDSIYKGYHFFVIRAPQDAVVKARIDDGRSPTIKEIDIYTSRGANGEVHCELVEPTLQDFFPSGFYWTSGRSSGIYCIVSKDGRTFEKSTEKMNSIQNILNAYPVQFFNKEEMTLTLLNTKDAYNLDQKLRNSKLELKLFPLYAYSLETKVLSDKFIIYFTSNTSSEQISHIFEKVGIKTYSKSTLSEIEKHAYGNAKKYVFYLPSIVETDLLKPLIELWHHPFVKLLRQDMYRNPHLPPKVD